MAYIETNGYFTYDSVKSSTYGVWINGGGTYNAAKRRYKSYSVPGRNGDLTIDECAFEEIEHTYPAFIVSSFASNIETFRNLMMSKKGHLRLTDTYHTSEYYRARYMSGLEVDVAPNGIGGSFDLKFMRDPRRFLTSGETKVTVASGGNITNPTLFASRPVITVTGYGTLVIGSDTITISNSYAYVDINSEIQDCYHGTDNANGAVTFQSNNFPVLEPGSTGVTYSGNITKVEIIPNWFIL